MSKTKSYMEKLSEKLGKEINELTQEDMENDFSERVSEIYVQLDSIKEIIERDIR
jgi:hypothetical protein